jgi:hypothetical protein
VKLADNNDVASLRTLGASFNSELDPLAFFEVFETIALDCGEVDENIGATFASEKAIAFATIEPFDSACNTF